jgi:hypothetical protein
MGSNDMKEMDAGTMDPSGRGLTQAGKICGIVALVLLGIGIIIAVLVMGIGILSAAASR